MPELQSKTASDGSPRMPSSAVHVCPLLPLHLLLGRSTPGVPAQQLEGLGGREGVAAAARGHGRQQQARGRQRCLETGGRLLWGVHHWLRLLHRPRLLHRLRPLHLGRLVQDDHAPPEGLLPVLPRGHRSLQRVAVGPPGATSCPEQQWLWQTAQYSSPCGWLLAAQVSAAQSGPG